MLIAALHLHLLHHPGPTIDYAGVAVAALLSWIGLPGPGEPVLIAAGIFAARHKLDISPVIAAAFFGATVGGIAGWLIGLAGGRSVLAAPGPLRNMRLKAAARGEELFKRMEVVAILLTPSWVAGLNRSGPVVYLLTNEISALAWAVGIGLGAYYFGPPILEFAGDVGLVASIGLVLLVGAAVGAELIRRRRRAGLKPRA
jgi:membrane protein DedA with SNARE-associated domain